MKAAIMQPYVFPYIGYFQLVNAVDTFVFYDDVHFIKGGWINRNNILINNKAHLLSIPLVDASPNKLINEIKTFPKHTAKFLKSIELGYRKAPFFNDVYELITNILNPGNVFISDIAFDSVVQVFKYLGIEKKFIRSSECHSGSIELRKEYRLFDICKKENSSIYINPIGGQEMYKKENFKSAGIDLFFIKSKEMQYKQFQNDFIPWLSIIDVLMFNSIDEIKSMLDNYELI